MKIDKPAKPVPASLLESQSHVPAKGKPASAPAARGSSDATSVSLGSTAAQMRSIEGDIAGAPAVNSAKVAEIKQAISEGRFRINPEVVADRLLDTVRDLIGSRA